MAESPSSTSALNKRVASNAGFKFTKKCEKPAAGLSGGQAQGAAVCHLQIKPALEGCAG